MSVQPYINCSNANILPEQLFRLMAVQDADGNVGLRVFADASEILSDNFYQANVSLINGDLTINHNKGVEAVFAGAKYNGGADDGLDYELNWEVNPADPSNSIIIHGTEAVDVTLTIICYE